uniref:Uridine kinase n=1 Tax=Streptomyces sp. NBC_00008 TaxID=2903610 RepID=A0AAU2VHD6_9ACTN
MHWYRRSPVAAGPRFTCPWAGSTAYDVPAFARTVLTPLGPGGDRRYWCRIVDLPSDRQIDEPPVTASAEAVLIVDGSFLQRSELAHLWDEVVFAGAGFPVARRRGTTRDAALFGGLEHAENAFDNRYHAACRRNLAETDPAARATVVGNDDVDHPVLHRVGDLRQPQ